MVAKLLANEARVFVNRRENMSMSKEKEETEKPK